ncbi:DUF4238 domain-containing protein [Paucibacter sp. M5-1]|uniref:DUF4238 domain-containing protein n=1 Tax=Paucibacter sp. M5-1 TaxID=3015998 RepID=UPI0022B93B8D|nr:DUF4238 domain-containing protein [Paucibacter sp. M5-1]MCZ7884230.1 DUF4238 domain-containing protein [Paucibacter sp. M5-1]
MSKHGRIKHHAKQHFVAQCYTRPWCDPESVGPKSTPYVWLFDLEGHNARRKAPVNLFTENDIYTIVGADGERDLRLEHGLCALEDQFTRIRNKTFFKGLWPDEEQFASVLAFVCTAHSRTRAFRDFHKNQWSSIRERMEDMQRALKTASPVQREAMVAMSRSSLSDKRGSMGIEDVRNIERDVMQVMLSATMQIELPMMARMSLAVLRTDDSVGFVTSDVPVMYMDPTAYRRQPMFRSPTLGTREIEVSMPLSPSLCLLLTHRHDLTGFIDVSAKVVNEMNRQRILRADESFIANRNDVCPQWFEHPPMPDDAWEKVRERKIACGEWPAPRAPQSASAATPTEEPVAMKFAEPLDGDKDPTA